jgi:hypothetical protein
VSKGEEREREKMLTSNSICISEGVRDGRRTALG